MVESNTTMAAITERINGIKNLLLTLELELNQLKKQNFISNRAFLKRKQRISALHRKYTLLLEANKNDLKNTPLNGLDLDFLVPPGYLRCPEDTQTCMKFLKNYNAYVASLLKQCSSIAGFMQKAHEGSGYSFFLTFKLSQIRRKIISFERKLASLQDEEGKWKNYAKGVCEELHNIRFEFASIAHLGGYASNTDHELKSDYVLLDHIATRLAKLEAEIEVTISQNSYFSNWLAFQEWKIVQKLPMIKPFMRLNR